MKSCRRHPVYNNDGVVKANDGLDAVGFSISAISL